jgi:hypothetical protein
LNGEGISNRNWKYQLRIEHPISVVRVYNSQHELIRVEEGKSFEETMMQNRRFIPKYVKDDEGTTPTWNYY